MISHLIVPAAHNANASASVSTLHVKYNSCSPVRPRWAWAVSSVVCDALVSRLCWDLALNPIVLTPQSSCPHSAWHKHWCFPLPHPHLSLTPQKVHLDFAKLVQSTCVWIRQSPSVFAGLEKNLFPLYEFLCVNFIVTHSFSQLDEHALHFLSFFKILAGHSCFYIIMELMKGVLFQNLKHCKDSTCTRNQSSGKKSQKISQVLPFQCPFEYMEHPGSTNQCKKTNEVSLWKPVWGVSLSPVLPVCCLVCEAYVEPPLASEDCPCLSSCAHSPCCQPICTWLPAPKGQGHDSVNQTQGIYISFKKLQESSEHTENFIIQRHNTKKSNFGVL